MKLGFYTKTLTAKPGSEVWIRKSRSKSAQAYVQIIFYEQDYRITPVSINSLFIEILKNEFPISRGGRDYNYFQSLFKNSHIQFLGVDETIYYFYSAFNKSQIQFRICFSWETCKKNIGKIQKSNFEFAFLGKLAKSIGKSPKIKF